MSVEHPFVVPADADFTLDFRIKPGQTDQRSELTLLSAESHSVLTITLNESGEVSVRTSDSPELKVGPYAASRWYNAKVRVTRKGREVSVELQDDHLNVLRSKPIALPQSVAIKRIVLNHAGTRPGSWIMYNALSAYQQ